MRSLVDTGSVPSSGSVVLRLGRPEAEPRAQSPLFRGPRLIGFPGSKCLARHELGVRPDQRRKALVNALGSEKPMALEISTSVMFVVIKKRRANSNRTSSARR